MDVLKDVFVRATNFYQLCLVVLEFWFHPLTPKKKKKFRAIYFESWRICSPKALPKKNTKMRTRILSAAICWLWYNIKPEENKIKPSNNKDRFFSIKLNSYTNKQCRRLNGSNTLHLIQSSLFPRHFETILQRMIVTCKVEILKCFAFSFLFRSTLLST